MEDYILDWNEPKVTFRENHYIVLVTAAKRFTIIYYNFMSFINVNDDTGEKNITNWITICHTVSLWRKKIILGISIWSLSWS